MKLYSRLLLSVYIITFLMGVPANIVSFCTFCCKVHRKATPIDILLLNLTVSDLIFLLFLPFKMKEALDDMDWLLPYPLCPFTGFLFYVTIYNSTLLLTAVSVERYLGVAFPLRYSVWRRPRYAVMACIAFWVVTSLNLSVVYIVPYIQWNKGAEGDNNGSRSSSSSRGSQPPPTCYHEFTDDELAIIVPFRLELFIVLFCIPFLICCFCYVNFILILSHLPNIGRRRRFRAIGLALGTLIVFAVCFGPYNASHVVGFAQLESQEWRSIALLFSTLNACLDPIIFYFSSSAVRSMWKSCCRSVMAKLHILRCGGAPHQAPHQGPHQGPHKEPHKEPHQGPHQGPQQEPHQGPHKEPHQGPQQEPQQGPQQGPHKEPHQGPQREPHQEPHQGPQREPHQGPQQEPQQGPQQEPHKEPHQGPQQKPHQEPHQGPQQGPHQGPHEELHEEPHNAEKSNEAAAP